MYAMRLLCMMMQQAFLKALEKIKERFLHRFLF